MEANSLFAEPRHVDSIADCEFYHVMEIPGHGVTQGQWDLRGKFDEYIGYFPFDGKRVLEIGPASGFLTFEMEKQGAQVVAIEVPDDPGWDFVPYPDTELSHFLEPRRKHMERIKNSFWFNHRMNRSSARLCYCDVYNLPDAIGLFDVAVLGAVLLHCQNPLRIIDECAKRSRSLVISDMYHSGLEGQPLCRLIPTAQNRTFDTWWQFSTDFFRNYLDVSGFPYRNVNRHQHMFTGRGYQDLFTIVASKDRVSLTNGRPLAADAETGPRPQENRPSPLRRLRRSLGQRLKSISEHLR